MRLIATGLAVLIGIGLNSAASAAPQVLGLTASNHPIPFTCDEEACSALAGTFCLQRERAIPAWGAPYTASHPDRLTLVILGRDGRVTRLGGGTSVRFTAYDGYTMVRMTVPRDLLAAHEATSLALEIGPGISLVPTPQAGDTDPQGADEIALATGPMRIAAARYLDRSTVRIDAARLVATLVNALPEKRTIHDDHSVIWPNVVTENMTRGLDPAALSSARTANDRCRDLPHIRLCLMSRHRELMARENARYWDESAGY
jgi:hypothetical protein